MSDKHLLKNRPIHISKIIERFTPEEVDEIEKRRRKNDLRFAKRFRGEK